MVALSAGVSFVLYILYVIAHIYYTVKHCTIIHCCSIRLLLILYKYVFEYNVFLYFCTIMYWSHSSCCIGLLQSERINSSYLTESARCRYSSIQYTNKQKRSNTIVYITCNINIHSFWNRLHDYLSIYCTVLYI